MSKSEGTSSYIVALVSLSILIISSTAFAIDTGWSNAQCHAAGPANDIDRDGLVDSCEFAFASIFRPQLAFFDNESTSERHSFWAVRPQGATRQWLFYALSYLQDGGDDIFGGGHLGDTEFIIVEIEHQGDARWSIRQIFLSAHFHQGGLVDRSQWWSANDFSYTTEEEEQAVIFVAENKHANYPDRDSCENGGLQQDQCAHLARSEPVDVRVERNLGNGGSAVVEILNRVEFDDDDDGEREVEWFWDETDFCGWHKSDVEQREGCVGGQNRYGSQLREFGFATDPVTSCVLGTCLLQHWCDHGSCTPCDGDGHEDQCDVPPDIDSGALVRRGGEPNVYYVQNSYKLKVVLQGDYRDFDALGFQRAEIISLSNEEFVSLQDGPPLTGEGALFHGVGTNRNAIYRVELDGRARPFAGHWDADNIPGGPDEFVADAGFQKNAVFNASTQEFIDRYQPRLEEEGYWPPIVPPTGTAPAADDNLPSGDVDFSWVANDNDAYRFGFEVCPFDRGACRWGQLNDCQYREPRSGARNEVDRPGGTTDSLELPAGDWCWKPWALGNDLALNPDRLLWTEGAGLRFSTTGGQVMVAGGDCPHDCSAHGTCGLRGCNCDNGFEGVDCSECSDGFEGWPCRPVEGDPCPEGELCDDGDPNTDPDRCLGGQCRGVPVEDDCSRPCDEVGLYQQRGTRCPECLPGGCLDDPGERIPVERLQCAEWICDPDGGIRKQNEPGDTLCDDANAATDPDICVNGECRGQPIAPPPCIDSDADGFSVNCAPLDCDDDNASVHPDVFEICGDGHDNDCVGGDDPCPRLDALVNDAQPVADAGPLQDAAAPLDARVRGDSAPDATEGCVATSEVCDGVDNDCDDALDEGGVCPVEICIPDRYDDVDGFCRQCRADGTAYLESGGAIDDGEQCTFNNCDPVVGGSNPPLPDGSGCNDRNANTDGDRCTAGRCVGEARCSCLDSDNDGFYSDACRDAACPNWTDCDDADSNVHPGVPEQCGNDVDEDCNGEIAACACEYGTCAIRIEPDQQHISVDLSRFHLNAGTQLTELAAQGQLCLKEWAIGEAFHDRQTYLEVDIEGWVHFEIPPLQDGAAPYAGCRNCPQQGLPYRWTLWRCDADYRVGANYTNLQDWRVTGDFYWSGTDDGCNPASTLAISRDGGGHYASGAATSSAHCP